MDQLLEELSNRGIRVFAQADLLRVQAPKGALTEELKESLKTYKSQLLTLLNESNQGTNLYTESFLESTIFPENESIEQYKEAKFIVLTGATGFLGAFLLQELLQEDQANVYCLVRANSDEEASQKIKRNLIAYGLWSDQFNSKIIGVRGDLSQPRLGLTETEFEHLAQRIDIIYHNGALVNWVYSYAALKPANVLGTQEILRLACRHRVKPVHYISTLAVLGADEYAGKVVSEAEPLTSCSGIELGYSQSKWVAEKLVLQARDRSLPVTIYRPPLISGHSQTGVWNTDDIVCRIIKGCIQLGRVAELDYPLNLSPVDYVARAIIHLSKQPTSIGQVFHLNGLQPLPWMSFVDWLRDFGYKLQLTSYEEWLEGLNQIPQAEKNPLSPLLPFFGKRSHQGHLLIPTQINRQKVPKFSSQTTRSVLLSDQIICPPIDSKLLTRYFQYFIDQAFLSLP